MRCKECGIDAMIAGKKLCFEGDESPDTGTRAFYELTYQCRNPQCPEFGKVLEKTKVYLD